MRPVQLASSNAARCNDEHDDDPAGGPAPP
ncbi:penicillin-binding protein 1C, partial [Stenotrophomonas maltophilia]